MNNDKLKILERRIQKLEERIRRQVVGPEVETSKKILAVLKQKYAKMKDNNSACKIPEVSSSSTQQSRTEDELISKLGAIYWIFGSSYEEIFSYKKYRIDFIEILPRTRETSSPDCLMSVKVKIYENDGPLATEDAAITFWKGFSDSTEVDDLGFSCNGENKYCNCYWFEKLSYSLAKTWNQYFRNVPLLTAKNSGLLGNKNSTGYLTWGKL